MNEWAAALGAVVSGALAGCGPNPPTEKIELAPSGLNCEVLEALQHHCLSCHSSPPINGAPFPLLSYEDLTQPSATHPGQAVAQVALALMTSTENRMPPPPADPVDPDHYQFFADWVDAGTPRGTCDSSSLPPPGH